MNKTHFNNILNQDEQLFGFPMVDLFIITFSVFIWTIVCQKFGFIHGNIKIAGFVAIILLAVLVYIFKAKKRKGYVFDLFLRLFEEFQGGAVFKNEPNVLDKIKVDDNTTVYLLNSRDFLTGNSEKKLVVGYEVDLFDIEKSSIQNFSDLFTAFYDSLPEDVYFRVIFDRFIDSPSESELKTFRGEQYFNEFHKINSKALIFLEKKVSLEQSSGLINSLLGRSKQQTDKSLTTNFLNEINWNLLNNLGLNQRQISENKIKDFLNFKFARYAQKRSLVDSGLSFSGIIKLVKINEFVDPDALLTLLDSTNYDLPIKVVFSTKKVRKSSPRFQLTKGRLKLKRNTSLDDDFQGAVSEKKMQSSQKLIDQIELNETNLFDFELHIIIEKSNESEIVDCAKKLITDLSHIGDFTLETLRPLKALKSCMPSENHHSPLTFNTESLFCLTPLYTNGDGNTKALNVPKTSILFHRRNMTESYFDMFSALSYSTAIIGATGTGKSFLMNLIISCLYKDDMRSIFHIDVGSSGFRNAQAIGSKIFNISMSEVTGMNPFRVLDYTEFDLSIVEVLSSFLKVLLKEDSETYITKEVSAGIENAVLLFCQEFKKEEHDASLKGFVDFCISRNVNLPRINILDRWVNGLYKKAISDDGNKLEFSRTNYFNFSDIDQANNSEFVEAVTMACFSLVSLQKKVNPKYKQTIVCDEFKFQKARSLDNFITIATNYRKVDGALIIGAQSVDQISSEENSQILESMAHTFIFNRANTKWKNDILNLTDVDMAKLKEVEKINGFDAASNVVKKTKSLFREVLYKNAASDGLIYRIIPSKLEYWKLTSKISEVEKIAKIQELTGATLDEAVGVVGVLL